MTLVDPRVFGGQRGDLLGIPSPTPSGGLLGGGAPLGGMFGQNPLLNIGIGLLANNTGQGLGAGIGQALLGARQNAQQQQQFAMRQQLAQAQLAALQEQILSRRGDRDDRREREEQLQNAIRGLSGSEITEPGTGETARVGGLLSPEVAALAEAAPEVAVRGLLENALKPAKPAELEGRLLEFQQAVALGLAEPGPDGFRQFNQNRRGPTTVVNTGDNIKTGEGGEVLRIATGADGQPVVETIRPPRPTAEEAQRSAVLGTVSGLIDDFEAAIAEPGVTQGPGVPGIGGMALARRTGIGLDPAEARADSASSAIRLGIQQALTRGDVSESEARVLLELVPQREDPAEKRRQKVSRLRTMIQDRESLTSSARRTTAPGSPGSNRRVFNPATGRLE